MLKNTIQRLMVAVLIMGMVVPPGGSAREMAGEMEALPSSSGLYRTRVAVRQPADWARLERVGVTVLEQGEDWALVLADEAQLEALARLRFEPRATDDLGLLVDAHAKAVPRLAQSVQPVLECASAVHALNPEGALSFKPDASTLGLAKAKADLRAAMHALSVEQRAGIASLTSIDDDGDGLTNVEEQWWCTDPNNPNTDGDAEGYTDREEVYALLDFTLPRSVRWGYGPPFGPPNAWPDWNGQDEDPETPACNDGDYDTIPDFAEVYFVGSRVPAESTDNDKFDDGQELFGVTYCPGAPTSCGYGNYPRIEYWNYIKETMPNWVRPPGDNIFVAAFPVPEVSIVPGSWTVERVTTITTEEGEMVETTKSYETSVMRGQSTSIANTVTWNEWEEVSEAVETPLNGQVMAPQGFWDRVWGGARVVGGHIVSDLAPVAGGVAGFLVGGVPGAVVGYVAGSLIDEWGDSIAGSGWDDMTGKDQLQNDNDMCHYPPQYIGTSSSASIILNQNFDFQGVANSLDGVQYAINRQGDLLARGLYDISYAISQPRYTETRTHGRSWGGAQTTTQEVYEEHTQTEGIGFTTGQNWSTAWAVDSSHAAELTFNYTIKNTGTEYAREITGLVFNVYLGDDPNPIVSYPAWEQFPDGKLENVFPGDTHNFASTPVPLTLDQMRRIDLGERLLVVLEGFSYGADELFYRDAINGGLTVFIEDGVEDGDELVDSYVIPTWGTETVQDVIQRYFPTAEDDEGNLISMWSPEFDDINPPVWNEYYLSDIAWWNIYQTCQSEEECANVGSTPLQEQTAQAGSAILLRFNRDSDRDGYQDRVELRYGTDKDDPASHPNPEMLAGYVETREGDVVTVKLALENTGSFDAYGIDAVMYAPDDTTTIGNNTVGGNGRVRPGQRVAVGSLVLPPELSHWTSSTARPYAGGNYASAEDKVYTFSVTTPGVVGQGSAEMGWDDGTGNGGTLDLGSDYHAPLPVDVGAEGLLVGFDTGTLMATEWFTVAALTPRDTFTYTINSEPYTSPVIVVSYSDPQGSHRFISPIILTNLTDDLMPYSGQMLEDVRLDVVATAPVSSTGINTTTFVFNSPHPQPIEDAHLYINFVVSGTLVAELPFTTTLEPGPTVYPVAWSTSAFTQPYDADADYLMIAFWTDAQGNIIDSAARPLSSFQADPKPTLAMTSADTWDFGTVTEGEVLHHTLDLANTGFLDLLAYVSAPAEMGIPQGHRQLRPADVETYHITLDTGSLPTGPYSGTMTIRTSDPDNPELTLQVTGVITDASPGTRINAQRPLDLDVVIPGDHDAHEWITFTHTLGPDPESLHPTKVYSQDGTLLGVGRYATHFGGEGMVSYGMFGDGSDGELVVSSGQISYTDNIRSALASTAAVSQSEIVLTDASGFEENKEVLIIQMQGTGVGSYEFRTITGITGTTLALSEVLTNTYTVGGTSKVQVIQVPHYRNIAVQDGGTLTAHPWNGSTGGVLVARVSNTLFVDENGVIDVTGPGFRVYQTMVTGGGSQQCQGEGYNGTGGQSSAANYTGGGGGRNETGDNAYNAKGGGGGGHATPGGNSYGVGGTTVGQADLGQEIHFGGAGGHGGHDWRTPGGSRGGGNGGGIAIIGASDLEVRGAVRANGENGRSHGQDGLSQEGGYGGGAGGSVYLIVGNGLLGVDKVSAIGGSGGTGRDQNGGPGGLGRVRIEYCNTLFGSTDPPSSTQKLDCYIIEQVESAPYDTARLNLPEAFTGGHTYQVQYGRRLVFTDTGTLTTTLRVPASAFGSATLDALVSDVGAGPLTFTLDIGNDGSWEWQTTRDITGPVTLPSPDLAAAFNQYWAEQGSPSSGTLDVPVQVHLSQAGQVLLTNLYMPSIPPDVAITADDITFGVSPTIESAVVPITITLRNEGGANTGGFTAAFYASTAGWGETYIGGAFIPSIPGGGTAQATIQWNTLDFTGTVPVRIVADPYERLTETDEENNEATASLTILTRPDLHVTAIELSDPEPVAGQPVTVTLTISNAGQTDAGTSALALYDGNPESGGTLVCERTAAVPGEGETALECIWTPATPGPHRLFTVSDRDDAVSEFDEGNNQSWEDVYVGFAGPLLLDSGGPTASDPPYTSTLGYGVVDEGQADILGDCGSERYQTYRLDPDGRVVYRFDHLLPGHFYHLDVTLYECGQGAGRQEVVKVDDMTVGGPEDLGDGEEHRLSILLDPAFYADRAISVTIEAYEGLGALVNEIALHDVDYRYADSDTINDPQYPTGDLPYGWLDGSSTSASGSLPYQTARVDLLDNDVRYQFDGLETLKRYQVHLSFYQGSGNNRVQQVWIDGQPTGTELTIVSGQRYSTTVSVPLTAFQDDGSIVVSAVRTNASVGAMINEIALEEETQISAATCQVTETPYWTIAYGSVTIVGQPAPPGTVVTAESPRGDVVGCFIVKQDTPGLYGFMTIYGEDPTANPPIPGMRDGELVTFRVNGALAVPDPPLEWHDDKTPHPVDIEAGITRAQPILLTPGWNLISFYVEPPVPLVDTVLQHSILGKYCLVLGEKDIYDCEVPEHYRSLKELHGGRGYYLRLEGGASANLLVEGVPITPTTPIPLHPGWNWVGYLPRASQPVTVALQSIVGHYLWVTDGSRFYDPALPEFSTLTEMEPGHGYLIYPTDAVTLTYPSGDGTAAGLTSAAPTGICPEVAPTPYFTLLYGSLNLNSAPAPVGTRIEVITPRGEVAGCFIVDEAGQYGFMPVYGEDAGNPPIPGFREGEPLTLRFNGWYVASVTTPTWTDDKQPHRVDMAVTIPYRLYLPLLLR